MNVNELMEKIINLDTEMPIFRIYLMKSDHTHGFTASVDFRGFGQNIDSIETGGDTPEEALRKLWEGLLEKFMSREYYMKRYGMVK